MVAVKQAIIDSVSPEYAERTALRNGSSYPQIWKILDQVYDPELPGLSLWDLGVLQSIEQKEDTWEIGITLTYSGCPAVECMQLDIISVMRQAGYSNVKVKILVSPIWSSEMMSPQGRAHLKSIQIVPPNPQQLVSCPICDSHNTKVISEFGSTACKALYQCLDCQEAFDYFKSF
ncbi:MAG: 1,2-phenylacetyl-CoA epoxidase subunit PaaD [Enterobacterales bacterium]|nr:1,2-phenylacetyl-CoA epoxidase subunit PaaD [Enterobacterales bacterium]